MTKEQLIKLLAESAKGEDTHLVIIYTNKTTIKRDDNIQIPVLTFDVIGPSIEGLEEKLVDTLDKVGLEYSIHKIRGVPKANINKDYYDWLTSKDEKWKL